MITAQRGSAIDGVRAAPAASGGAGGRGQRDGDAGDARPTRERILDAAVELFGRQGYKGTSVGEIEAAAGLVPRSGALYKHFASKRALLEVAVRRRAGVASAAGEIAESILEGDVAAEAEEVGRASLDIIRDDQPLLRIVMREGDNFPELRDEFHDRIVSRGHATIVTWLRRAAERTGARDVDFDALAALVFGSLVNYRVLTALFGTPPRGVDERRFLATWTDSTLKLLAASGLVAGEAGTATTKEGTA